MEEGGVRNSYRNFPLATSCNGLVVWLGAMEAKIDALTRQLDEVEVIQAMYMDLVQVQTSEQQQQLMRSAADSSDPAIFALVTEQARFLVRFAAEIGALGTVKWEVDVMLPLDYPCDSPAKARIACNSINAKARNSVDAALGSVVIKNGLHYVV